MAKILLTRITGAENSLFKVFMFLTGTLVLAGCGSGPVEENIPAQLETQDAASLTRIAAGLERSGDLASAARFYTRAVNAAPDNVLAQVGLARIQLMQGDLEGGFAKLEALHTNDPNDIIVAEALTRGQVAVGAYAAAYETSATLAARDDISPEMMSLAGRVAELVGDTSVSREMFGLRLEATPLAPNAAIDLAMSFALDGAYATAQGFLEPLLARAAVRAQAQRALAFVYALSGNLTVATETFITSASAEDLATVRPIFEALPDWSRADKAAFLFFERTPSN